MMQPTDGHGSEFVGKVPGTGVTEQENESKHVALMAALVAV